MMKQASVAQLRSGELGRKNGYLVVCMAYYPRGLKKEFLDEYRSDLAPDRELFREWKEFEESSGHEEAFNKSNYEERFTLSEEALAHLKVLSEFSRRSDVYLFCQCALGERCHREILMLTAQKKFDAPIDKVFHDYPRYLKRLAF
jgi:uncharacterized protein YeaO (DUF488 family)